MSDELKQLLHNADESSLPATPRTSVSGVVRERMCRERKRRQIATAVVVVAIVAAGMFLPRRRQGPAPIALLPPTITAKDLSARLAALAIEADAHAQIASALRTSRPAVRTVAPVLVPDTHLERDRAALILVYDAEQYTKQNNTAQAIADYRRVIELFPQSHWAQIAQQRLKEMQT